MTDEEYAALSEWERQEWFEEIHSIMEALMRVKPLVICSFDSEIPAELLEGDDDGV